jgi:hypothetical protein
MAKKNCKIYTADQLNPDGSPKDGAAGIDTTDTKAIQRLLLENIDKLTPEDFGVKPKKKEAAQGEDGGEYKSLVTKAISQSNVSDKTKALLMDRGITYPPLSNKEAQDIADALVAEFGGAEKAFEAIVKDVSGTIPPVIKVIIAGGARQKYGAMADAALTEAERNAFAEKEADIIGWLDEFGRKMGEGIQAIGYMYKQSQWGVANAYKRAFDKANAQASDKADKVVPDIKDKVNSVVNNAAGNMNEAANDVFGDNQKEIDDLKKENEELKKQLAEAPKGGKKNPVQLFKERAKKATGDIKDAYDLLTKPQTKSLLPEQMGALITVMEDMVRNGVTKAADIFSALEQAVDPMYAEGFEQAYLSAKENLTGLALDTEEEIRLAADNTANNIAAKIVANNAKIAAAEAKAKERKAKLDANKAFRDYEREHKSRQQAAKKEAEALIKKYEAEKSAERKKQIQDAIKDKENKIKEADAAFKLYENEILSKQRELEKEAADLVKKYEAEQNKERKKQLKEAIEERRKNDLAFGIETAKKAPQVDLAERIYKDAESLNFPKTKKQQDVLAKMLTELQRKAKDFYKGNTAQAGKSNKDLLNFAALNLADSKAIWNNAKQAVIDLIDADQNYSAAQKQQLKDFLDNYQQSIFDTLLSNNKAADIVKEALKEKGFVDQNGNVDWKKIIGRANTTAEAKQAIEDWIDSNTALPKYVVQPLIDQIARRYDNIVRDKIDKEIAKLLKKKKLGSGISPKIDRLIMLAEQGMLNNSNVKSALSEQFGIITMNPDQQAEFDGLIKAYANAPAGFLKAQAGENLEGFLDRVVYGPRIQNTWDYVKGEATLAAMNMPSVFTMRMYGFMTHVKNFSSVIDVFAEILFNAIQTRSLNGIKVAMNEMEYGARAFQSVLLSGDVGTSASTNNELANTGKKYPVRTMEQRSSKAFGVIPDFFAKIGDKTYNLNLLNKALRAEKYNPRLAEAVDSFNWSLMSASAQYAFLVNKAKKENPSLTNKQANTLAYEQMYGADRDAAKLQAKEDFKAMGVRPSKARFERRVLEIMVQERDATSRQVGEKIADEVTLKNRVGTGVFGVAGQAVSTLKSFVNQWLETQFKNDPYYKNNPSRIRKVKQSVAQFFSNTLFPFVTGVANILERAAEFDALYGTTKGIYYLGKSFNQDEEVAKYVMRQQSYKYIAKGITGAVMYGAILALLAASDDDDDKSYFTGSKVKYGEKPNTLRVFGMNIRLELFGSFGIAMSQYADARNTLKEAQTKSGKELEGINKIYPFDIKAKGNTMLNISFLQNFKNIFDLVRGDEYAMTKYAGSAGSNLIFPFAGASRQTRNFLQPKAMERANLWEELADKGGIYSNWLLDRPARDAFGREYNRGENYGLTGDFSKERKKEPWELAFIKREVDLNKPIKADEEDKITRTRYPILKQNDNGDIVEEIMDNDKFYKFKKLAGETFLIELKKYYQDQKEYIEKGDVEEIKKDVSKIRNKSIYYALYLTNLENSNIQANTLQDFIKTMK